MCPRYIFSNRYLIFRILSILSEQRSIYFFYRKNYLVIILKNYEKDQNFKIIELYFFMEVANVFFFFF